MEPDARTPLLPPTAAVELRALGRLRERVEAAAREIERLRAENAALAERLAALHAGVPPPAPALSLPGEETPAALRARIVGFIETIDRLLAGELPLAGTNGAPVPDWLSEADALDEPGSLDDTSDSDLP